MAKVKITTKLCKNLSKLYLGVLVIFAVLQLTLLPFNTVFNRRTANRAQNVIESESVYISAHAAMFGKTNLMHSEHNSYKNHSAANVNKTENVKAQNKLLNAAAIFIHNKSNIFTRNSSQNLFTWFTTFKITKNRHLIHLNTLVSWAKFIPFMQPVLFSSNSSQEYDSIARDLGWHVYEIPRTNEYGTPYISDMVDVIMNGTYDSVFYGFANGDILFDNSLVATLTSIIKNVTSLPLASILLIGQRTNYKMSENFTVSVADFHHIEQLRRKGRLFSNNAEDYFIFSEDFPRHLFKDLVIGRPAYDNYLVAMAVKMNVTVIDATKTLTAVHQQSPNETEMAGHNNKDAEHNVKIIGKKFKFRRGLTSHAQYETYYNVDRSQIILKKRIKPKISLFEYFLM